MPRLADTPLPKIDFPRVPAQSVTSNSQVSGDIALGCRWRVTSLDVLSLQVRGKQEELDYKQELVAIIRDWCVVAAACVLQI